jgi:hypothetical protein
MMDNVIEIIVIVGVIGFQTFSGYIGNKYLGAVLPIAFSGLVLYFAISGILSFSFRDILMPILGLGTLIAIYEGGKESKKKKIEKEIEKMKVKDNLEK